MDKPPNGQTAYWSNRFCGQNPLLVKTARWSNPAGRQIDRFDISLWDDDRINAALRGRHGGGGGGDGDQ